MDKRYQVFVSSTYADLREERQQVIQTLMEMDCIPSGMELFPAADEEQWEFIRRVIDDCDYYLLIIGGRYGSTTEAGVSYTEKEYDYAIEKGIRVIALLHARPDDIPMGKSETDPQLRGRLNAFRDRVAKNRLVKFWTAAGELPGLVALSLSKTIKTYPAVGWVRGNTVSSAQLLNELNELRKRREILETEISQLRESHIPKIPELASLDEEITVSGYKNRGRVELTISWAEIFGLVSPHLLIRPGDEIVKEQLGALLFTKGASTKDNLISLDDNSFQTIKVQFQALNFVDVKEFTQSNGYTYLRWSLTEHGNSQMLLLCSVKSKEVRERPDHGL